MPHEPARAAVGFVAPASHPPRCESRPRPRALPAPPARAHAWSTRPRLASVAPAAAAHRHLAGRPGGWHRTPRPERRPRRSTPLPATPLPAPKTDQHRRRRAPHGRLSDPAGREPSRRRPAPFAVARPDRPRRCGLAIPSVADRCLARRPGSAVHHPRQRATPPKRCWDQTSNRHAPRARTPAPRLYGSAAPSPYGPAPTRRDRPKSPVPPTDGCHCFVVRHCARSTTGGRHAHSPPKTDGRHGCCHRARSPSTGNPRCPHSFAPGRPRTVVCLKVVDPEVPLAQATRSSDAD